MKKIYSFLITLGLIIPLNLAADGTATVTLRPTHIDISTATSQSAVLMTLSGYSTNDVKYRLYSGSYQYNSWDATSGAYISSTSYASGPLALGSPSTGSTFWIPFERGSNTTTSASYRDRLGPAFSSNNNTAALPAATEITSSFSLTGTLGGTAELPLTNKYVVLSFNGSTLVSAVSSDLTTGAFTLICPEGTPIDKVEVRTLTNTIVGSVTGSYTASAGLGTINLATSSDNKAPVFSTGFPKLANIDATKADLQVSMDEAGKAYYVVVPDGATAPTVAEVVAGTNYGTVTLVTKGIIDVTAGGGTYSATLASLTDKTNYDIYVVAEDDETTPNRQTEAVKVDLYTVRPPEVILNSDFQTTGSLAPFTAVSVTGDQVWGQSSGYAKISGYVDPTNFANLDYLISPAINLDASENNMLNFRTMRNYPGPDLKVMISSNFSGTYTAAEVSATTWTDITSNFSFSTGSWESVNSGEFSLSAYTGIVYIAFVYESTADGAATWEVDDVKITGYLLPGSDASLSDLKVDGTTITSFVPATLTYEMTLEGTVTTPPAVTYTTTDPIATAVITNASNLAGDAAARTTTVVVTAADGITTQTYSILFKPIIAVANMEALRAVLPENYNRIYQVTGEVVVSGINDSQRHQKYIQDASAGILIDDADGKITTTYSVGDGIKGLTGTLTEYAKLLEFVPYRDPGTASSTGNILTPQVVTVDEFNTNQESYESELVKIVGVKFTDANGTAAFQEKKNYSISVGTDATILRTIFLGTDLTAKIIPYMADVTGIATVYNTDAQLAPRNYADLVIYSSDATLSDLKVSGTTVTGFAAGTLTYNLSLPAGTTAVPAVTATPTEANATVVITPATSLTGDAAARTTKIDVTSHDKSSVKNYTIVFTVATGIGDNLSNKLRIYPVPARSEITAEGIEGITLIEIYEVTGKKVTSIRCAEESSREIPVANLRRGLYFMKFIGTKGVIMEKFIKE